MSSSVSIVLVGLGGYGEMYLSALFEQPQPLSICLVGAVDPAPERCSQLRRLRRHSVPIFDSLDAFYGRSHADLAVISSPIHYHCEHTLLALSHGSFVLCEKPAAATTQEVDRMIASAAEADRWIAIGFQWSFATSIHELKTDILRGAFGAPVRLKSLTLWPRPVAYYHRNDWAGRLRDEHGRWILDSPANNAMAHDLHNMLYVLGAAVDASAAPATVQAETYRANPIETFDTIAARIITEDGAELLFYASHAVEEESGPVFCYEFTDAVVHYDGGDAPIVARYRDGRSKQYASPHREHQSRKLWTCAEAVRDQSAIPCPPSAARSHTLCVNAIHESHPGTVVFPTSLIRRSPQRDLLVVDGLTATLRQCYDAGAMPSELGRPWARPASVVTLHGYTTFPRTRPRTEA